VYEQQQQQILPLEHHKFNIRTAYISKIPNKISTAMPTELLKKYIGSTNIQLDMTNSKNIESSSKSLHDLGISAQMD